MGCGAYDPGLMFTQAYPHCLAVLLTTVTCLHLLCVYCPSPSFVCAVWSRRADFPLAWHYNACTAPHPPSFCHVQGWPEPYIHTVYDRMYGDFPVKNTHLIHIWFWPTLAMAQRHAVITSHLLFFLCVHCSSPCFPLTVW